MGKNKGSRIIITLECDCKDKDNNQIRKNGVMRYTSSKNKRNTPNRIQLQKFCRYCNKHCMFKEIK
uniref:Large ribosomal subunit protein bL33c n=1 Tax=Polysiphonia sertularioides TaxID=945028 RepID=A0A1Z1M8T0_9FLOR|nr:ribosomal protein L33 [Polysiphonia sertularioides]ARW62488.1 ribosomal protein L33 [Polysiphonia sertularioides]